VGSLASGVTGAAQASVSAPNLAAQSTAPATTSAQHFEHACADRPEPGHYACFALRRTDPHRQPKIGATAPAGYGPADLSSAYKLPAVPAGAAVPTVYVIDAYGYSAAESDLGQYRLQYGLPVCTIANGCFQILNQRGAAAPLPAQADSGWRQETALDLAMVSATCPLCHITLVQTDDSADGLLVGVGAATSLGGKYVSMSWGGPESGNEAAYDNQYFSKTGVVFAAASGDGGYAAGASYPATSTNAVAVGGTSLVPDGSARGWSESAWNTSPTIGTGSGCSSDENRPQWQQIIDPAVCAHRADNDISAVADPNTGVAVYYNGGWGIYGGTSAAAPIIASMYALAGVPGANDHPAAYPYSQIAALNDVTAGSNGSCSAPSLCTAGPGWDGPTGFGTPLGVSALAAPSQTLSVPNPGTQLSAVNNPVNVTIAATQTPAGPLTFTATGLPAGLTINAASGVVSGTPTALGLSSVTVRASGTAAGSGRAASFSWRVASAGTFVPVKAARVLDTRKGIGAPGAIVPANGSITVQLLGRGGLPSSGVSAVVMNVTSTASTGYGYVTVYPDNVKRPVTSNLNFSKGVSVPNLVVAPVGPTGKVVLYSNAATHLIADVAGYYLAGQPVESGTFKALTPVRLLDTRYGIGAPASRVQNAQTVSLTIAGRGGVPTGVSAVVLNVTAVGAKAAGYITVYPPGTNRPVASSLNFPAHSIVPNLVVVPVVHGAVDLYVYGGGGMDLVADVSGYFTDRSSTDGAATSPTVPGAYRALTPYRALDTRSGRSVGTAASRIGRGGTVALQLGGSGQIPAGARAVVLNVAAVNPNSPGYATVYNADIAQPATSNLNFSTSQTIANLVEVPISASGVVNLTVNAGGTTDLVADVQGYYLQ